MATREENIKKINDELEKLSDEQLESVAGGMNNKNDLSGLKDFHVASTFSEDADKSRLWDKIK